MGAVGGTGGGVSDLSVAFEPFGTAPLRRGLYVQLLGERVQLVGERGTKVPDMSVREFMCEVEASLTAVLEWTQLDGWQVPESSPLDLSILQLDHRMRGNTLPLPRTALKGLLNMFLPGVVTRLLTAALPPELGQYVCASAEPLQVSGEFQVRGPPLSTYMAPLCGPPKGLAPTDPAKRAEWGAAVMAAARARHLLDITDAQAEALSLLFSGPQALCDPPRPASICELCRLATAHAHSALWGPLSGQWHKALQAAFVLCGVPPEQRFTFSAFMEGPVARLARKPVQVAFMIDSLKVNVDVDCGLSTVRDLLARLMTDLHKRVAAGDDKVAVPSEPLDASLEALDVWHAAMAHQLRVFKSRFRAASASLMMAADKEVFQFGMEGVTYDGPLRIRLPLDLVMDPDHACVMDVKLPQKEAYLSNVTSLIREIVDGLENVAQTGTGGSAAGPPQPGGGAANSSGAPGSAAATTTALLTQQLAGLVEQQVAAAAGAAGSDGAGGGAGEAPSPHDLPVPVLDSPVVGQISLRKLAISLRLDEERLAELLDTTALPAHGGRPAAAQQGSSATTAGKGGPDAATLSTLLGCYGDLFSASLDVGWRPDHSPDAPEGATRPAAMLTVANNEVTRVMASLESLMFGSTVSPQVAVSVLAAVMRGILLRWYAADSYQVTFWALLFRQLHEYLGRDALNALACLTARLEVAQVPPGAGPAPALPSPLAASVNGAGAPAADATAPAGANTKMRLILRGDTSASGGAASAPGGGGGGGARPLVGAGPSGASSHPSPGQTPPRSNAGVPPVYLLNEINLLTLLDSVKLLTGAQQKEGGA